MRVPIEKYPKYKRKQLALVVASGMTMAIVGVWFAAGGASVEFSPSTSIARDGDRQTIQSRTPFATLKEGMSAGIGALKSDIAEMKSEIEQLTATSSEIASSSPKNDFFTPLDSHNLPLEEDAEFEYNASMTDNENPSQGRAKWNQL